MLHWLEIALLIDVNWRPEPLFPETEPQHENTDCSWRGCDYQIKTDHYETLQRVLMALCTWILYHTHTLL